MSKPNNIDGENHHYVPRFYLRKWYLARKKYFLRYKRNRNGLLQSYKKPSKTTCDAIGLYLIQPDGLLPQSKPSNEIEAHFLTKEIDNPAAMIHAKILSQGISSLSREDRLTWARFISSLIERSPKRIDQIVKTSEDEIAQMLLRLPPEKRIDAKKAARNAVLYAMARRINDNEIADEIDRMHWYSVDHSNEGEHFLTSDNPLVINAGKEAPPFIAISLALSPERLMVMCVDSPELDEDFVKLQAAEHSILMCRQAEKYIISSRPLSKGKYTDYLAAANLLLRQPR